MTRHNNGIHVLNFRSLALPMLACVLALAAVLTPAVALQTASHTAQAARYVTAHYSGTTADVPNPGRGFYDGVSSPASASELENIRNEGVTVVHDDISLAAFRASPLSASFLQQVSSDFAHARTAGVELIPRFAYDFTAAGQDAPLHLVLSQIGQLSPILHANADVIGFVDAGFIGAWGEWHASSNHLIKDFETNWGHEVNHSTRAIFSAMLHAVPRSRMITVRTDRYVWQLLHTLAPVTARTAYDGSARSRTAIDNDCFLADGSDIGTYVPGLRAHEEAWLSADTRYVVQDGEVCASNAPAAPYIACRQAMNELRAGHWVALGLNSGVRSTWEQQGCLSRVQQDLGYRLRLVTARVSRDVSRRTPLQLRLKLANDGFAAEYNQRPVDVVLRNQATGRAVQLPISADPRTWAPGKTSVVNAKIHVPSQIDPGVYHVLLSLPNAAPQLQKNPAYSIQFANSGTWEAGTGYNDLHLNVVVR